MINLFVSVLFISCLIFYLDYVCIILLLKSSLFLDIQVKEPTPESIIKKMKTYLPPRFMSVKEAASQLLELVLSGATEGLFLSKS